MAVTRRALAEHRRAAGYSQEALAEALRVEPSTVGRWERGQTCPQPWVRPKLARILDISDRDLAELLESDMPDQTRQTGSQERRRDKATKRRELLTLVGTTVIAPGLLGTGERGALPVPERVDRAHVRSLQSALAQLRTEMGTVGGGAVLPQALRHFDYARRMLDESDYTAAVGRELLVVTADLGIKSAWAAFDADDQPLTRRLHEETALLADSAGTGEQCVHLYVNMVHHGTWLARHTGRTGFAREALRFAERAAGAVRHEPSPALHAFVSLRHALAHAQLGDEVAFRSAIATARRELDRGPHDTDPTWTQVIRQSMITSSEAAGNVHLGAPTQAVRLYESALDDSTLSPRDQAITRSKLAETLAAAGDLHQAISHGLMILPDLGTTLSSGRVLQQLRPVRDAADGPAAAEFCERFDAAARALRAA